MVNDELGVDHIDRVGTIEKESESVGVGEEDKHREGERERVPRADSVPELEGQLDGEYEEEESREREACTVTDTLGVLVREVLVDRVRAGTVWESVTSGVVDHVERDTVGEADDRIDAELVSDGEGEEELDPAPLKDVAIVSDKVGVALCEVD